LYVILFVPFVLSESVIFLGEGKGNKSIASYSATHITLVSNVFCGIKSITLLIIFNNNFIYFSVKIKFFSFTVHHLRDEISNKPQRVSSSSNLLFQKNIFKIF